MLSPMGLPLLRSESSMSLAVNGSLKSWAASRK